MIADTRRQTKPSQAARGWVPAPQASPRVRPARMRVLLSADQRLVEESLRVVLAGRGLLVSTTPMLGNDLAIPAKQRAWAAQRLQVGIAVGELGGEANREMVDLVRAVPIPWLVLVRDPAAVTWGFLVEAGIVALLPTSITVDRLLVVMTRVLQGQQLMSPQARAERIASWQKMLEREHQDVARVRLLSVQEQTVVAYLDDGMSIAQIATLVDLPPSSVRTHVRAILRKLEATTQVAAVATYRRGVEGSRHPAIQA